jgi:hypothetical protein
LFLKKRETKNRVKGVAKYLEDLGCTNPIGRAAQAELDWLGLTAKQANDALCSLHPVSEQMLSDIRICMEIREGQKKVSK